ncbi:tudor domain-containing protein 5 [Drosophila tropicalis]|uniref:tudor domain-containing protein 5 n=1 Tax=Drosophila tropicalis TaxID=46794 RepID=UPI0035AC035B
MQENHEMDENNEDDSSRRMNAFMKRVESYAAIPSYALTDDVFSADRPRDAANLSTKILPIKLFDTGEAKEGIKIIITEIYTPFQFWFRFENFIDDVIYKLEGDLHDFYNQSSIYLKNYDNQVPNCFIKPGYICACYYDVNMSWRRARILSEPVADNDIVSVFYIDYGAGGDVSRTKLRFLPKRFTDLGALALRGCLSHIHPLGPHWPESSLAKFRHHVLNKELYSHVVEMDQDEGIAFMRISYKRNMSPSINKQMVVAHLAGESEHYSKRMMEFHCGRRIRYMRERLPSFDMLESGCYPMWGEDFEQKFDDIICDPAFYVNYQPPKIKNPFLWRLEKALELWLVKYKEEEEVWRKLYKEANEKLVKENEEKVQKILSAYGVDKVKDNKG